MYIILTMAEVQLGHKFIPTARGGRYLCVGGFMYRLNKRKRDWISWRCLDKNCGSTASTSNDIVTMANNHHNHPPVHNEMKVKEKLLNMKTNAKSSLQPMPSLFDEEINKMRGDPAVSAMPTFESHRMTLYRARRSVLPQLPTSRQDLVIPADFQITERGEQFLLQDDGVGNRIVIFATDSNLEKLCAADIIYGDGTFYSSPKMFYQLYTIHAMVDGQMFPLVFAFLPDKREDTYRRLFQILVDTARTKGFQLSPQCIQMDYETAARNATGAVFPGSEWKGCFFHFTQCIWRRTQYHGLQEDYKTLDDINRFVRRCAVLPLIPVNEVDNLWVDIAADMPNDARCTSLADYVTSQWIEGDLHTHQWNHHETTWPRTNNHLEGYHSRLNKLVRKAHPNIFEAITFIKSVQMTTESRMQQYGAGAKPPSKKRKYVKLDETLQSLKLRLQNNEITLMQYADSASFNLKLC